MKMFFKHSFLILFLASSVSLAQENGIHEFDSNITGKIVDSFILLHPDTVAYRTEAKSYKWNYELGLMLYSIYQYWETTRDDKYFGYIKKNIDYYINDDGSIKTYKLTDFNIDNLAGGRVLLKMYEMTKEEKYKKAADTLRKQIDMHPRTSEGGFWHKKIYPNQMWLDGLYMAQPFYTMYTNMFGDQSAYADIAKQFILIKKYLRDESTGLYFHGWDETRNQKWADPVTGRSPNFWGRSLGWFMMALVDVIEIFPENHKDKSVLIQTLKELSESVTKYRDKKTGLWYQVIDKGDNEGNYLEASASAMFTYAFAKGANLGYLDGSYRVIAEESFRAIFNNLVTTGDEGAIYLNQVCSVSGLGGNPYRDGSFDYYISEPQRTNDFKGYGPFILAAVELSKTKNSQSKIFGLDYYFNNEYKDGKQWHYVWEDETNGGFSELGCIIKRFGGEITAIKGYPTKDVLRELDVYIIVDPDTYGENNKPNFIDEVSINNIVDWVKGGGVLVVMANDSSNCEFEKLNLLMRNFSLCFNSDRYNLVQGKNFDQGKFEHLPNHPIFNNVSKIYMKEICSIDLWGNAKPILEKDGKTFIAESDFGRGRVVAIGDPWLYNEYIDNRKLPVEFQNFKAAENFISWLIGKNR